MKKSIALLVGLVISLQLMAQNNVRQQLVDIFDEAEKCYLLDDYQQLQACVKRYADTYNIYQDELGDSIDVFLAYYYKMNGALYYGVAGEENYGKLSEQMYRNSLEVFLRRGSTKNIVTLHEELAQLYYKQKAYGKAKEQLDSVLSVYHGWLFDMEIEDVRPKYYQVLSQVAMCEARLGNTSHALSLIDNTIREFFKKKKDAAYYEALRKRGKILMLQADQEGKDTYKSAADNYRQYIQERCSSIEQELSGLSKKQREQYWLSTHQFLYDCFRLGNRAPEMLYDLTLFSKDYLIRKNATRTDWRQVRKSLKKDECAIEFVQYFGKNDERRIGCLVLKFNSAKPFFLDMFAPDSLLELPLVRLYNIGESISTPYDTYKDTLYHDTRLQQIIWSPTLMKAIGNVRNIYFSPDGVLHQLAIEYMIPDTTITCYRLSSTRLLTQKRETPKMKRALLCGGMTYDTPLHPYTKDNDVAAYRFLASRGMKVKYLPGTRKEVDSIRVLRNCPQDSLLVDHEATDENFMQLLKQHYDVIHISTHGYFSGRIGINSDIKPLLNDESMSRSGLLFSGSEKTISDKNFNEELYDGILSANEISGLDLSQSELVVLSACQTGLGHLTDDGIYGIQRGLKQAGASAMILSLWNVNDNSTNHFMRFFYEELEKQTAKNIHVAFLKARQRLKDTEDVMYYLDPYEFINKKKVVRYNTPRFMDPFIIIDAF